MKKISRRSFLKVSGTMAAAGALAACGGSSSTSTAASSEAAPSVEAKAVDGLPDMSKETLNFSSDKVGSGSYNMIVAMSKVLEKAGLTVSDIDLFEINEAFAAQCVACQRTLGIDEDKLNVNGGGISLGHPVGATGSRLVVTLLYELKRRGGKYGLATLCAGGGMGTAVLIKMA